MKKLLGLLVVMSMLVSACSMPWQKEFEEVSKIDVSVSDYVEDKDNQTDKNEELKETDEKDNTLDAQKEKEEIKTENKQELNLAQKEEVKTEKKEEVKKEETQQKNNSKVESPKEKVDYKNISLSGKTICIDASHGEFDQNKKEELAPNTNILKDAFKEGTKGEVEIEDNITIAVANILKAKLEEKGAKVIMTRTDNKQTMTNIQKAQFANDADICIKLHADGASKTGSGMTVLVPSSKYISDKNLISKSKLLGKTVLNGAVYNTGAKNNGLYANSQMTGFNWSKVPVIILEMGNMTNPSDEKKLADTHYQGKIAKGILEGILEFYR